VERFSPRSRAILEIQSSRDLEILEKIYANSVLLGDDGPDGWGVKYAREFDMTNDSKLLIPRSRFERDGVLTPGEDVRMRDTRTRLREAGYVPVWEGKTCYFDTWLGEPTLFARLPLSDDVTKGVLPSGVRRIARGTDARTLVTCLVPPGVPTTYTVEISRSEDPFAALVSWALLSSFTLDYLARLQVDESVPLSLLRGLPVPRRSESACLRLAELVLSLLRERNAFAERLRIRVELDVLSAAAYGLDSEDLRRVLTDCDWPVGAAGAARSAAATGFWRVDKDKDPELRHTVLTMVAFYDLEDKITAASGDRDAGVEAFLAQNQGEGWLLPETLRLADYGLGHDERAKQPQPVASRLGPRFYDWQLAQGAEESWRECHVHARNLLGERGYQELLDEIAERERGERLPRGVEEAWAGDPPRSLLDRESQGRLW
jgi:hypothetical protein